MDLLRPAHVVIETAAKSSKVRPSLDPLRSRGLTMVRSSNDFGRASRASQIITDIPSMQDKVPVQDVNHSITIDSN